MQTSLSAAQQKVLNELRNFDPAFKKGQIANASGGDILLGDLIQTALTGESPSAIILPNGQILVGNSSNKGAAVALSGDATIANTGALTLASGLAGAYARKQVIATYNFATLGGALGDISLVTTVPANAVITRVWLDVITQPTSLGSATIALKLNGAADMMAATAIASLTVGLQEGKQDGTAAKFLKNGASAVAIKITVATAALTAGKFYVVAEYAVTSAT